MLPANIPAVRAATARDAAALRALAGMRAPLTGRIFVAESHGAIAAAISQDDHRVLAAADAPAFYTARLRLHVAALAAFAREPELRERVREAVLGPRTDSQLPLAA